MEKFKKQLRLKIILHLAAAVGLLAVYGTVFLISGSNAFRNGFGAGLCTSISAGVIVYAVRYAIALSDEKQLEKMYITATDERYLLIREKTASGSFVATIYIICIGAIISSFFSQEITMILAGVIAVMTVCKLCFKFYYERKY